MEKGDTEAASLHWDRNKITNKQNNKEALSKVEYGDNGCRSHLAGEIEAGESRV